LEDNEKIDIKKNDCETLELIFENDNRAPYELNSGDYKLNITAKGEYGVNRTFVNSEPFIVNLKFNQNRKDVLIKDARMDSKIIQCNENSVKVFYTIMNNGESDLDAAEVRITNRILNIFGVAYHSIKGDNGYTDSGFIELELPRDKLFDGSFIFEVTPSPLKSRAGIKTDRTEKLLLKREGCGINYKDWLAKKESGELDVNDNSDDDVIENDIVETVDDLNPIDNDSDILIETTDDKNDVNNNVDSNNKSLSFDVDKIVENRTVDDGSSIFKNILWFLLIIFIIVIIYFIFNLLF
ncbi:hypothetical protein HN836_01650, partial [Candidatus Woesearchaeota archaeon]|nr:hypothetical protein [Candidatus Woesearchaeota archaeon]